MKKTFNVQFFYYELMNNVLNGFSMFFGIAFPMILSFIISIQIKSSVPQSMMKDTLTSVAIGFSLIIPLATGFIGYTANYATELESHIPDRLYLFGFSQTTLLVYKILAALVFLTSGLIIFAIFEYIALGIALPSLKGFLVMIVIYYVFSIIMLVFAHGISNLVRKFGLAYAITMVFYFGFMILSGMMGISVHALPNALQIVSKMLPTRYFVEEGILDLYKGLDYNLAPLLQSLLLWAAIAVLVLWISYYYHGRKKAERYK